MGKKFEFIDSTRNDKLTRRLARSHAMKGKNTGKTHQRRSRPDRGRNHQRGQSGLLRADESPPEDGVRHVSEVCVSVDLAHHALADTILSIPFPIEAAPQSQYVINQFFEAVVDALNPPSLCHSLDVAKSYWIQVLFVDTTIYHCTMSLMDTLNEFFLGREAASPNGIYHLNQAVSMVNQTLNTPAALSNSCLSVVNFLIVQEMIREAQPNAEIHMKGLAKMIELRGGLSQLGENNPLAVKICKTDLDYALHYGTRPYFYRDRMPDIAQAIAADGFFLDRNLSTSQSRFHTMNPFLQQILRDVLGIASLFNMHYGNFKLNVHVLQEVIVSVGCRLARFHPLGEPQLENRLDSACHMGLTAFITTLFIQFGGRHFLKYRLVAQYMKNMIETGIDEMHNDLMLWLLFIGGVSVLTGIDQDWLSVKIHRIVQSLDIKDWEGVQRHLVRFPWLNILHDESGKFLWDSVTANNPVIVDNHT